MTDKLARTLIERLRTGVAEFPIIIENPALIMNEAADKLEAAERVHTNIEAVIADIDFTKPLNIKDFMAIGSMITVYRMQKK